MCRLLCEVLLERNDQLDDANYVRAGADHHEWGGAAAGVGGRHGVCSLCGAVTYDLSNRGHWYKMHTGAMALGCGACQMRKTRSSIVSLGTNRQAALPGLRVKMV